MTAVFQKKAAGFEETGVINAPIGSNEPTFGEIVVAALENAASRARAASISDMARENLLSLAIDTPKPEGVTPQQEKNARRERLVEYALKVIDPEKICPAICAAVAHRQFQEVNDGFWLLQTIVSNACTLAVREVIRRKQESGLIAGVHYELDDTGTFVGFEAGDQQTLARDNRENSNIFSRLDNPDAIEGTFKEFYEECELSLSALANACVLPRGQVMLYGEHSRWINTGKIGSPDLIQVIETFDQRLQEATTVSNDRNVIPIQAANSFASFR